MSIPTRFSLDIVRSHDKNLETRKEIVDYNTSIFQNLEKVLVDKGIEKELNLFSLTNDSFKKSLKMIVENQFKKRNLLKSPKDLDLLI